VTTRVLAPSDYGRLDGLDVAEFLPLVKAQDAQIVIAEAGERIVGVWGVFRVVHLEGVWIAPEYRRHPRVVSALLHATFDAAQRWAPWAFTGAATDPVRRLIRKLGGKQVPMDTYAIPLVTKGAQSCRQK
jgi:hypothetical protein